MTVPVVCMYADARAFAIAEVFSWILPPPSSDAAISAMDEANAMFIACIVCADDLPDAAMLCTELIIVEAMADMSLSWSGVNAGSEYMEFMKFDIKFSTVPGFDHTLADWAREYELWQATKSKKRASRAVQLMIVVGVWRLCADPLELCPLYSKTFACLLQGCITIMFVSRHLESSPNREFSSSNLSSIFSYCVIYFIICFITWVTSSLSGITKISWCILKKNSLACKLKIS